MTTPPIPQPLSLTEAWAQYDPSAPFAERMAQLDQFMNVLDRQDRIIRALCGRPSIPDNNLLVKQ